MTSRENILARIRGQQRKGPVATDAERAAVRSHIGAHPGSARPRMEWDPVVRFRERALGLASSVDEVEVTESIPSAVARYLRSHELPLTAVCWPELAALDWRTAGIDIAVREARDTDLVGITGAYCAIAETGTLMMLSGPDTPSTVSMLPETHVAVVSRARVVRGMEEAWQLARGDFGTLPRAVNFISGPSRTADIEQTVTLGAHGPYRVHLVLAP